MLQLKTLQRADLPWPLLLEADPHAPHVETYLTRSTWFGLHDEQTLVGVAALLRQNAHTVEVMNIAVVPARRRSGVGLQLMRALLDAARAMGARRVDVGTGNSSLAELAFYQRAGFRITAIERDYFLREYPQPIVENGIACRDRVLLSLSLDGPAGAARRGLS